MATIINFNSSAFIEHDNMVLDSKISILSGLIVIKLAKMILSDNVGGQFVFQGSHYGTRMIFLRNAQRR